MPAGWLSESQIFLLINLEQTSGIMTVFRSLHHLDASQGLNGTLCFILFVVLHRLCPSSPTRPPTSSALNKAGAVNVGLELLTGTAGVTTCPRPSLMSQLMNGTSLLMLLQFCCLGNETKMRTLNARCAMSLSL